MSEKLKSKYHEVLRERDNLINENKRIRHDYDTFVKQTDQVIIIIVFFQQHKYNIELNLLYNFIYNQIKGQVQFEK